MTKDDYSWSQHDLVDGREDQEDNEDSVVHQGDIGIQMDTKQDHGVHSLPPVTVKFGDINDEANVQLQEHSLRGNTIETSNMYRKCDSSRSGKNLSRFRHTIYNAPSFNHLFTMI